MIGLLIMAGVLALGSGVLKLFGKGRRVGEVPLLALVEMLVGVGVPVYATANRPSPGVMTTLLFLTLGLVLFSSVMQVAKARAQRHHRAETEAARLVTYVKFLSRQPEGGVPKDDRA